MLPPPRDTDLRQHTRPKKASAVFEEVRKKKQTRDKGLVQPPVFIVSLGRFHSLRAPGRSSDRPARLRPRVACARRGCGARERLLTPAPPTKNCGGAAGYWTEGRGLVRYYAASQSAGTMNRAPCGEARGCPPPKPELRVRTTTPAFAAKSEGGRGRLGRQGGSPGWVGRGGSPAWGGSPGVGRLAWGGSPGMGRGARNRQKQLFI